MSADAQAVKDVVQNLVWQANEMASWANETVLASHANYSDFRASHAAFVEAARAALALYEENE